MSGAGSNSPPYPYNAAVPYDAPITYDPSFPTPAKKSLLTLREDMMIRLGYAAQLANPPPGMVQELNSYLDDAQKQLYWRYETLRAERWWGMNTIIGQVIYGTPYEGGILLDTRKVNAAFVADGTSWFTLRGGIDPIDYSVGDALGIPTHYEFREFLEIWPAPSKVYSLWFKGQLGLKTLALDTDTTTVDEHLVFLFALAMAKNHRGQPDANAYAQMADRLLKGYVGGAHGTRRYVPRPSTAGMKMGGYEDFEPWTRPRGPWATP